MADARDAYIATLLDGASLPDPPAALPAGDEAIVAVWREGALGAVLSIFHDPEDREEPFSVDIEVYRWDEDGWRWWSTGGSDWPLAYGERPVSGPPALTGFATTLPGADDRLLWSGIAPTGCDRVAVGGDNAEVVVADERTGAFIAALPYPPAADAVRAGGA